MMLPRRDGEQTQIHGLIEDQKPIDKIHHATAVNAIDEIAHRPAQHQREGQGHGFLIIFQLAEKPNDETDGGQGNDHEKGDAIAGIPVTQKAPGRALVLGILETKQAVDDADESILKSHLDPQGRQGGRGPPLAELIEHDQDGHRDGQNEILGPHDTTL